MSKKAEQQEKQILDLKKEIQNLKKKDKKF